MIHRHKQNPYRDDTYDKERDFVGEDLFQEYERTSSQGSGHNRSNKYAEEYSFNKNECFSNKSSTSQGRERVPDVYQPSTPRQEDFSSDRNGELMRKYSSIYHKLLELESIEVIFLFLEEIEENERYRQKLTEEQRHSLVLQQETKEIKALLEKKREAIRRLCETQSYNLNIIECMQLSSKQINWDSHFMVKYQQLEKYMNEYIANTNEAQQEYAKSFKLLKMENRKIAEVHQQLQKEHFECSRELKLVQMRHSKCVEAWNGLKERENAMIAVIEKMKEENAALRQQMEELNKSIRANEQFQIVLSKENKELSSELDFIRDKMGDNSSLSRDIFEKSESDLYNKLAKEKQELQGLLSNACKNLDQALKEKNELSGNYSKLIRELEDKQALIEQLQKQAKTTVRPLGESSSYKLKNTSNRSLESSLPTLPRNCKEAYQYETLF